jgi:hypothetical protein
LRPWWIDTGFAISGRTLAFGLKMDISGLKARLLIPQKPRFWEVIKFVEKEYHGKTS